MQDTSWLTKDGRSWSRDFCAWWFSIDLSDFGEGTCYVYPKRWAKVTEDYRDRTYLLLYNEDTIITKLGYVNSFSGQYIYTGLERRIEWMGIDKFVRGNWISLVNIARYGIEGCLQQRISPVKAMIEHVLNTMSTEQLSSNGIWAIHWDKMFPKPLDGRTEYELMKVIHRVLQTKGLNLHTIAGGYGEGVPFNNRALEWLVKKSDKNTTTKVREQTDD